MSVQIGILGIIITRIGLIRMSFRRTPVFEERYFTAIVKQNEAEMCGRRLLKEMVR